MEGSGLSDWTLNYDSFLNDFAQNMTDLGKMQNSTMLNQTDNITLTCEQIQEEYGLSLPIPINVENPLRVVQAVYFIIILVLGVILNVLVIVLTVHFKRLQNITFVLGLQVCICDTLNGTITLPASATNAIAGRFVFTGLCSVLGFVQFFLGLARTYLMFVLVVDRFCTVFVPFWFQRHRVKMTISLTLCAWMLAFTVALIPVKGLLDCYSVRRSGWACFPSQGCSHPGECLTYMWIALTLTNMSSVVSIVMYLILFCKARRLRNLKINIVQQPNVNAEEEKAATTQKLKRQRRANITFFLLYLSLIGVSLPPVIFLIIGRAIVFISGKALPTTYSVVEILAGSSFSLLLIIDPIVIMRNEDFREVVRKLWNKMKGKKRELTEVFNLSNLRS